MSTISQSTNMPQASSMNMSSSPATSTSEMNASSQPANQKKSGRPPNADYIKLMRPDEDWRTVADTAERRRIQNRLAQRAYRRNLREKNSEVEKLKKQLQKLKGGESRDSASSSSSVHSDILGSDTGKGPESSKSASPEAPEWPAYAFPGGAKEQESSSDVDLMFFQFASDIDESGSNASGIQLGMDGMDLEAPVSSGSSMHNGGVADALCLNFTTACTQEPIGDTTTYSCHTRASSFGTSEPDLYTPYLGTTFNPEVQGHINFSPPVPVSEDFPLTYAGAAAPSFQQLPRMGSPMGDPASSLDLFGTDTQDGDADPHWSPDTNASLLHFAVAGGNVETLRLLLKHKPHLAGVHDADGYTPIQRAIMVGRTDMVALFLEHADCF